MLRLEGELTIYRAAELHAMLTEALANAVAKATRCTIDLAAVTEADSCGVQLLLAARRTAREHACELTFAAPSAPLADALTVLGLAHALGATSPTVEHADGA